MTSTSPPTDAVRAAISEIVQRALPGARITRVRELGPDAGSDSDTEKAVGYGRPLRISTESPTGQRDLVLHIANPNDFGHDRRADRAAEVLLAYDTFSGVPRQVPALDVGAVGADGTLISLAGVGEFYLLTDWADGHIYADELRAIAERGSADERDRLHVETLATYLAELHRPTGRRAQYRRAIRDLVGSGEGVFGIIDGYPDDTAEQTLERLGAIEHHLLDWRWKLREWEHRAVRTHGDFHPFNLLFDDNDELHVLDASRGCVGDAADDVACLAINYVFFAVQHPGSWQFGFGPLWKQLWRRYLELTGDETVLRVLAPWLAWRITVLANPAWYPSVTDAGRDVLLRIAERALNDDAFDPASVAELVA